MTKDTPTTVRERIEQIIIATRSEQRDDTGVMDLHESVLAIMALFHSEQKALLERLPEMDCDYDAEKMFGKNGFYKNERKRLEEHE